MEEIKTEPLTYCSKCSICKELDRSPEKTISIQCFQWMFGILVVVVFILTVTVLGFLAWFWIGNRESDSEMFFHINSTTEFLINPKPLNPKHKNPQLTHSNGLAFVPLHYNFSEAAEFCRNEGWTLIDLNTAKDEELLQLTISKLDGAYFKHCNESFIGLRRIISEEWKTAQDEPIIGGNLFTHRSLPVKSNCVAMVKQHNYAISNVECTLNDPTKPACYICESKNCSDNFKSCFKLFIDFVNSNKEANERCQEEMPGSKLAAVVNLSLQQDIVRAYQLDDTKSICSYIFLGMQSNWKVYENVLEKRVPYESERLDEIDAKNDYCISISKGINQWKSVDCKQKLCFICRQ